MPSSKPRPAADTETRLLTRDGLELQATLSPTSAVLGAFYAGYDQAFVLPNEKETLDGFADCLALNQGDAYVTLASVYGEFREVVMVAHTGDGQTLGGANFIAYPVASGRLCVNLNYVYVLPSQRRKGQFKALVRAVGELAQALLAGSALPQTPLLFIEQNDPLLMSRDEYAKDTEYTGLDQVDRLAIWAKLGARIVDFAYVQPALSQTQAADPNLVYSVLGADDASLPACVLRDHLERFFAISVLKGRALGTSPEASAQLAELTRACQLGWDIALLDPSPALEQLRSLGAERFAELGAASFRAFAGSASA